MVTVDFYLFVFTLLTLWPLLPLLFLPVPPPRVCGTVLQVERLGRHLALRPAPHRRRTRTTAQGGHR